MYGCLTDGVSWVFVLYEHVDGEVNTGIVGSLEVDPGSQYFPSLHEVVKMTVNLCSTMALGTNKR
jgi:hypothetical protein